MELRGAFNGGAAGGCGVAGALVAGGAAAMYSVDLRGSGKFLPAAELVRAGVRPGALGAVVGGTAMGALAIAFPEAMAVTGGLVMSGAVVGGALGARSGGKLWDITAHAARHEMPRARYALTHGGRGAVSGMVVAAALGLVGAVTHKVVVTINLD